MSWYRPSSILDKIFAGGILVKGLTGVVELTSALLLVFIQPEAIRGFIAFATQHELQKNPHNALAGLLIYATQHFDVSSKWFAVVYLAVHGIIKLIAVGGIILNQLWAYPFSLITLGALMLYQAYSIAVHPTVGMIILTVFDIFILWLIWREYHKVRHNYS